jgi:chromosome segregation ATPase
MMSARRGLLVLLVLAPLGLWGCAQERNGAASTKIRDLAARNAKLEEDYRVATSTTDSLRKKLAQAETQRADLAKQVEALQEVVAERDELKRQVASRTGERDALHTQLVSFSKELQSLANRLDAAACGRVEGSGATGARRAAASSATAATFSP